MSPPDLVRLGGGLASIVSGVLLVVGHVLNLGCDPECGTVLIAHVVLIFALVALHAAQAERSSLLLGSLGMVLSVVGTALASAVVFVEITGASGVEVETVLTAGVLSGLGGLAFLIGLILFGIATMRADAFSAGRACF